MDGWMDTTGNRARPGHRRSHREAQRTGRRGQLAMAVICCGALQAAGPAGFALQAGGRGDGQAPPADSRAGGAAAASPAPVPAPQPWQTTPTGELARPLMPNPALEPPADQVPVLIAYGVGVQRYICKEKAGKAKAGNEQAVAPGAFEWALKEPVAKLADAGGRELGSHSAGPTWQLLDGSKAVKKQVVATVPALQSDAVPWLLIEIESSGAGALAGTRYVQRVDTIGGVAPAAGCDAAHAGATHDVDYRATYVFYAPRKRS